MNAFAIAIVVTRARGPDARAFLQGYVTQDMRTMEHPGSATYAAFLNSKGRTLYESVIYLESTPDGEQFVLDVPSSASAAIQKHVKMYKLRLKCEMNPVSSAQVFQIIPSSDDEKLDLAALRAQHEGCLLFTDPRSSAAGIRMIDVQGTTLHQLGSNLVQQ